MIIILFDLVVSSLSLSKMPIYAVSQQEVLNLGVALHWIHSGMGDFRNLFYLIYVNYREDAVFSR